MDLLANWVITTVTIELTALTSGISVHLLYTIYGQPYDKYTKMP